MPSHKGRTYAFRDAVVLVMHEHGLATARRPGEPKNLTPAQRLRSSVQGIPGWTVGVRNQQTIELASAVDEVERVAAAEGNELFVTLHARRGRPVEDSYATLPLRVLLRLMPGQSTPSPNGSCPDRLLPATVGSGR